MQKNGIFPKGLVYGFGQKFETFPSSYLSQNRPGKCVSRSSRNKKTSFYTLETKS